MTEKDVAETVYLTARAARDEAIAVVRKAMVDRAPDWLARLAYWVAEENGVGPESVSAIKGGTLKVADASAETFSTAKLSYSDQYPDFREAMEGGCAAVVNRVAHPFALRLGQELRSLGLRLPETYTDSSELVYFQGHDGFEDLLRVWAVVETDFRGAELAWAALAGGKAEAEAKARLADAWGPDRPEPMTPREPFGASADW
jgi:hypothetical protein